MEVEVELSKIIINETVAQQIIVLKECAGERKFPIVIGMAEILAIDRRLKGVQFPRPMTHDLLANLITQMGGEIVKIVISDLREHTYFANLVINVKDRLINIDCRPSDALALGAGTGVRIFVEEEVFEKM